MGITIQILSFLGTRWLEFIVTVPRGQCWGARKAGGGCFSQHSPSQQAPPPHQSTHLWEDALGKPGFSGGRGEFPYPSTSPPYSLHRSLTGFLPWGSRAAGTPALLTQSALPGRKWAWEFSCKLLSGRECRNEKTVPAGIVGEQL